MGGGEESVNTIIGIPKKLSQGRALAWVRGRTGDKCPFLSLCGGNEGFDFSGAGGSLTKGEFSMDWKTSAQLLLNLNFSLWPPGCLVFLSRCETQNLAAPLSLPLPLAPVTHSRPPFAAPTAPHSAPDLHLAAEAAAELQPKTVDPSLGETGGSLRPQAPDGCWSTQKKEWRREATDPRTAPPHTVGCLQSSHCWACVLFI